jgi:purine-nucleoside/S-methyl-5'-thioadenosine phosphorylase / adenosine deaminase
LLDVADHFFTAGDLQLRGSEEEWSSVAGLIGVTRERLLLLRQVHGAAAAVARRDRPGPWLAPQADVIASDDPMSAIGVLVADCTPVLVADRRSPAVAAAHAGWRGTAQGAAAAAVAKLVGEFGSQPSDLVAAIGPCLGPCCGEVGPEVVKAFVDAGHPAASVDRWFATGPSGRPYINLWQANVDQLEAAGVPVEHIHVAGLCTRTHADVLHSYRAARDASGRMVAVIRPDSAAARSDRS